MFNENQCKNNCVTLCGVVDSDLVFSHEVYNERYYTFRMKIKRLSDMYDIINITISERLFLSEKFIQVGTELVVYGQLRSYNSYTQSGSKLILTVFAKNIEFISDDVKVLDNPNSIYLNGFICKPPIYRVTPFGREIADLLIAVNRSYNKSDYLPSIAWGRNARYASTLNVGNNIEITGRIQSREYQKKCDDDTFETRVAYEVSISTITWLSGKEESDESSEKI